MLLIIIIILIFSSAFAQEYNFTYEPLGISLEMFNGDIPASPWIGGVSFAAPVLADIDADGDYDLFVGNGPGYIIYYENTGTPEAVEWTFITEAYDSIWAGLGTSINNFTIAKLAFIDIDNDLDMDLFVGHDNGWLLYYKNYGNSNNPIFQLESDFYDSIDVGLNSSPCFVDIDSDNDFDLFIGEYFINLFYYENIGDSVNAEYTLITDQFVNINPTYRLTPCFIDIDNDFDFDLFIGEMDGTIYFYLNTGDSAVYAFEYVTDNYMNIDVGDYSAPYFCDIDNDGDYDLFVGEGGYPIDTPPSLGIGDVNFYENVGDAHNADFELRQQNMLSLDVGWFNYPAFTDIDNDGDYDLFTGEIEGNLNFFRNIGDANSPSYMFETEYFQGSFYGWQSAAAFADIDADEDKDMIVAGGVGFGETILKLFRNDGPLENPVFTLIDDNLIGYTIQLAKPFLCDIDNDNDSDLFIGDWENGDGHLQFFENIGDSSRYNFVLQNDNLVGEYAGYMFPSFADIDNDDDFDLFIGEQNRILYYENIGTPEVFNYVLVADTFFNLLNLPGEIYPAFVDIDDDNDFDLFHGEIDGGLHFYRNVTVGVNEHPSSVNPIYFSLRQNYPNPFNASTTICYDLPLASKVKLTVYNITGQRVAMLCDGIESSGFKQYDWNVGNSIASGIYLLRMEAVSLVGGKRFTDTSKIVLIK